MTDSLIHPPNRLLQLLGDLPPARIPAEMEQRAQTATEEISGGFEPEMLGQIEIIYALADAADSDVQARLDEIYARTHELRGLCGSLGHRVVGEVAQALCAYVEEAREAGRTPRANIVWLHAAALKRAAVDAEAADAISNYLVDSLEMLRHKEMTRPEQAPAGHGPVVGEEDPFTGRPIDEDS